MKLTLLAAVFGTLVMTACGKPNQALPEQEKEAFKKITSQPATQASPDTDDAARDADADAGSIPD